MFEKIFIEEHLKDHPRALKISENFKAPVYYIDQIENHWGRVKKPYLQKRDNLNLFIGEKRGQLIKETPDAYGTSNGKHFYFIHAYNCIYECQYCYLQGYFHTPDIVLFINHEEIIKKMQQICAENPNEKNWFHAGEFSDSLALSHITEEWPIYWEFFHRNPNAYLELRTKSVNIKSIIDLAPAPNIITTFSLSPEKESKEFDLKTPSLKARINALKKLTDKGHYYGLHLDPIIYTQDFEKTYNDLAEIIGNLPQEQLSYISLGVVRFTKDVYRQVKMNYPDSSLHAENFPKSFDNKVRYSRPMRMWIMNTVKELLIKKGVSEHKIYLCME